MDRGERRIDLCGHIKRRGDANTPLTFQNITQRRAELWHHQIEVSPLLSEGHDWRDIWMGKPEDLDHLVLEARDIARVGGEGRRKHRDYNRAIGIQFQSTVHVGDAVALEQLLQLVLAQPITTERSVFLSHMRFSIPRAWRSMRSEGLTAMQPMMHE